MLKKIFCNHKWKALTSIIRKPVNNLTSIKGDIPDSIPREILFRKPYLVISCDKCGTIIEKEIMGIENS